MLGDTAAERLTPAVTLAIHPPQLSCHPLHSQGVTKTRIKDDGRVVMMVVVDAWGVPDQTDQSGAGEQMQLLRMANQGKRVKLASC